jgi:hypothetical protein
VGRFSPSNQPTEARTLCVARPANLAREKPALSRVPRAALEMLAIVAEGVELAEVGGGFTLAAALKGKLQSGRKIDTGNRPVRAHGA